MTVSYSEEKENRIDDEEKKNVGINRLPLPPLCARYRGRTQSDPLALLLQSIIPSSITTSLLELATTSLNPQYITHANLTHNESNNTTVALPTPNNHKLAVFHSPSHVQALEDILLPLVEEYMSQSSLPSRLRADGMMLKPVGLNPRLRILRYDVEDDFQPHYDKTTEFPERNQTSYITVLLYLNTLPEGKGVGGRTLFHSSRVVTVGEKITFNDDHQNMKENACAPDDKQFAVQCIEGSVCLFEHDLYHSGEVIKEENCTKWILRTDVLFQRDEANHDSFRQRSVEFKSDEDFIQENNTESHFIENVNESSILTLAEFLPSYVTVDPIIHEQMIEAFQELGISPNDTSLEAFITPGKQMVQCLTTEVESMVTNPISLKGLYDAILSHLKQ